MSDFVLRVQRGLGGGSGLARFRSSVGYDALMRAPLISWLLLSGYVTSKRLIQHLAAVPQSGFAEILEAVAGLAGLGFISLFSAALFFRLRPIARASGLLPRVAAVCG